MSSPTSGKRTRPSPRRHTTKVHRERLEKAGWKVGNAAEFLDLRRDPEFWKLIESRRAAGKLLSEAEVRRRLGAPKRS